MSHCVYLGHVVGGGVVCPYISRNSWHSIVQETLGIIHQGLVLHLPEKVLVRMLNAMETCLSLPDIFPSKGLASETPLHPPYTDIPWALGLSYCMVLRVWEPFCESQPPFPYIKWQKGTTPLVS